MCCWLLSFGVVVQRQLGQLLSGRALTLFQHVQTCLYILGELAKLLVNLLPDNIATVWVFGLLVAVLSLVLGQVIFHRLEGKFAQEL